MRVLGGVVGLCCQPVPLLADIQRCLHTNTQRRTHAHAHNTVRAIQNVHQAEKHVLHVAVQILVLSPILCMTL